MRCPHFPQVTIPNVCLAISVDLSARVIATRIASQTAADGNLVLLDALSE